MNSSIAIVTGASSGMGKEFAKQLARGKTSGKRPAGLPDFDELWLVARRKHLLEDLAAELSSDGCPVQLYALDIVESASVVAEALTGKTLALLINNAGYGVYGDFADTPLEKQLGQIDVNCRALTECCGRFSSFLTAGSLVINVASLASFAPLGGFAVYAASKAYVLSFSVGLASEWKNRGIRVCALCPGPVQSEFALVASNGSRKEVRHGHSAERTVRDCLKDAARGKWISMPLCKWRMRRFAGWLAGPKISALFAEKFLRRI